MPRMQVKMKLIIHFLVSSVWLSGVLGASLHGTCNNDQECGTIDTFCHKNVCVCKENFTVLFDSCIALAQPRQSCTHKNECHKALGTRSICTKKKQCACKPFHHLHMGQCVKNRDLSHQCDHDHQCYCGAGCEEKIACIHHSCSCKTEYSPFGARRCIIVKNEESSTETKENTFEMGQDPHVTTLSTPSTTAAVKTTKSVVLDSDKTAKSSLLGSENSTVINSADEVPSVILQSSVMNSIMMNGAVVNFPVSVTVLFICVCLIKKMV